MERGAASGRVRRPVSGRGGQGTQVALLVSYDGLAFSGNAYQASQGVRTVEAELLRALALSRAVGPSEAPLTPQSVSLERAGRTDAGVSAAGMVYSLRVAACSQWALPGAVLDDLPLLLNRKLGNGMIVLGVCPVEQDFSARTSAVARRYRYLLWRAGEWEVQRDGHKGLRKRGAVSNPVGMELSESHLLKLRECAALFVGTHDFSAFARLGANKLCGAKTAGERFVEDPVRTIFDCHIDVDPARSTASLVVTGSSFLYHQVRYMASAITLVGTGRLSTRDIQDLLDGRSTRSQKRLTLGPASRLVFDAALYPQGKGRTPGELPFTLSPAARRDLLDRLWVGQVVAQSTMHFLEEPSLSSVFDQDGGDSEDDEEDAESSSSSRSHHSHHCRRGQDCTSSTASSPLTLVQTHETSEPSRTQKL